MLQLIKPQTHKYESQALSLCVKMSLSFYLGSAGGSGG